MAAADPLQQAQSSNVLGKFKLIAELGRGGMSEVYLAVVAGPAGFNKLVVIKLIKAELAEDPDFINMFLEEARLSARLSHPNIVQTNEVGEVGGRYYIAMEYLEGQPYSRILHRLGRDRGLPLGMSLRVLSDVLSGLQYAHELADFDGSPLGVVHRDVTPHNVFVTYDGQVKVVDFGIAKAMNSSHETRTGMLKGKVGYMAPEQAKGERVDRRADIFSVGVMLWEAAVGRRLWKGLNEVQILHQLLSGEIPSPRSMRPDISAPLDALIMKSLASDRDKRHGSAQELQGALDELMDSGSERSTLREVGRLLSQTFDEERRKLKAIIEQQVAKTNMVATGMYQQMQLPAVDQPPAYTGELRSFSGNNPGYPGHPQVGSIPPQVAPGTVPQAALGSGSLPLFGRPTSSSVPSASTGQHPYMTASGQHAVPGAPMGAMPVSGSLGGHSHSGYSYPGAHMTGGHPVPVMGAGQPGSYPGAGSHPGARGAMQGMGVPRIGPAATDPDHTSQPSVSSSLAHASVSHSPHPSAMRPPDQGNRRLTMAALGVAAAAGGLAALLYVGLGRNTPAAATSKPEAGATSTASGAARPEESKTAESPKTTEPKETAPTADASQSASVVADPNAKEVTIDVRVKQPDDAEIFLDGKKVANGKLKTTIPRDGKEHELKVDAPGYYPRTRKIKAEESGIEWTPSLDLERRGGPPVVKSAPTVLDTAPAGPRRDKNGKIIRDVDRDYPGGN